MVTVEFNGQKLKALRNSKRLTQSEVAEIVGKKTSDISNYENGFANPPADILLSLQKFFDVDFSALSIESK